MCREVFEPRRKLILGRFLARDPLLERPGALQAQARFNLRQAIGAWSSQFRSLRGGPASAPSTRAWEPTTSPSPIAGTSPVSGARDIDLVRDPHLESARRDAGARRRTAPAWPMATRTANRRWNRAAARARTHRTPVAPCRSRRHHALLRPAGEAAANQWPMARASLRPASLRLRCVLPRPAGSPAGRRRPARCAHAAATARSRPCAGPARPDRVRRPAAYALRRPAPGPGEKGRLCMRHPCDRPTVAAKPGLPLDPIFARAKHRFLPAMRPRSNKRGVDLGACAVRRPPCRAGPATGAGRVFDRRHSTASSAVRAHSVSMRKCSSALVQAGRDLGTEVRHVLRAAQQRRHP